LGVIVFDALQKWKWSHYNLTVASNLFKYLEIFMFSVSAGCPDKLGVTFTAQGANFCVYGRLAKSVELLFFQYLLFFYQFH
jgi:hypothetical protein